MKRLAPEILGYELARLGRAMDRLLTLRGSAPRERVPRLTPPLGRGEALIQTSGATQELVIQLDERPRRRLRVAVTLEAR